jgi:predicted lipid-binding transport protein (Tim44 family)
MTLVLLAAAVFVAWRLFLVLGQRSDRDDPGSGRSSGTAPMRVEKSNLPPAGDTPLQGQPPVDQPTLGRQEVNKPVWQGHAEDASPLANTLQDIANATPGFTVESFLAGASQAYELILEAYAKGDQAALKPLLAREVMDSFAKSLNDRDARSEQMVIRFVGVKSAKVKQARLEGKRAQMTVLFVGEMVSAILGKDGTVIEGDPKQVRDVHDEWTFERDVSVRDPNWKLIGTSDGEI